MRSTESHQGPSSFKFAWAPKLSVRVQSHVEIWFLGNRSSPFFQKRLPEVWRYPPPNPHSWRHFMSKLVLLFLCPHCFGICYSPGVFLWCQLEVPSPEFLLESLPFCLEKSVLVSLLRERIKTQGEIQLLEYAINCLCSVWIPLPGGPFSVWWVPELVTYDKVPIDQGRAELFCIKEAVWVR